MRALRSAELLSIGTELTVGETRDTNAGDLARLLSLKGVVVGRLECLPDDLDAARDAFRAALSRSDLVVATGGLGPTPDDLTREAIAAALGEVPQVDVRLRTWLRELFERRGLALPPENLKQAWLIPSAIAIPNDRGTAPGWWIERPDGRILVALPGPPREMRPMWDGFVEPRLQARGLGSAMAVKVLRTSGLGESIIAERIRPLLERGANPDVATYARHDAVDVRITAFGADAREAAARLEDAEARVLSAVGSHVWATGETSWAEALGVALDIRRWRISIVEVGLRGALTALLGEGLGDRLAFAETLARRPAAHDGGRADPRHLAEHIRTVGGTEVGLAVEAGPHKGDTAVSVALADPMGVHSERRLVFLAGDLGRSRAAVAAASVALDRLRRP